MNVESSTTNTFIGLADFAELSFRGFAAEA
jgi:hypothetical protein